MASARKKLRKPHVTVHTFSSLDGKILTSHWKLPSSSKYFEEPAAKIHADAWIVGRVTMQEFSAKHPGPRRKGRFQVPPGDFVAKKNETYAVGIDPSGKCRWTTDMTSTEHVIMALGDVPAEHLDHLRNAGVSYVLAPGKKKGEIDLAKVLHKLVTLFGIETARIDGGGHVNGAFLREGLVDEVSVVIAPIADGRTGSLSNFEIGKDAATPPFI